MTIATLLEFDYGEMGIAKDLFGAFGLYAWSTGDIGQIPLSLPSLAPLSGESSFGDASVRRDGACATIL